MGLVEALGPPALVVGHGGRVEPRSARGGRAAGPDRRRGVRGAATPSGRRRSRAPTGSPGPSRCSTALLSMMETDYRGALRTMIGTANPAFDEETLRMRVNSTCENCPQDVAAERMRSWIGDDRARAGAGARRPAVDTRARRQPLVPDRGRAALAGADPGGAHRGGGGRGAVAAGHHGRCRACPDRGRCGEPRNEKGPRRSATLRDVPLRLSRRPASARGRCA